MKKKVLLCIGLVMVTLSACGSNTNSYQFIDNQTEATHNLLNSDEKDSFSLSKVYDELLKEDVEALNGTYEIVPMFSYQMHFVLNNPYFGKDYRKSLHNQLRFEYDKQLLSIPYSFDFVEVCKDKVVVNYQIEALTPFDMAELKVISYDQSMSIIMKFRAIDRKRNIGKTNLTSLTDEIKGYINSLSFYQFENKERLKIVDKTLYSKTSDKAQRETLFIWDSDVQRFIFDSMYIPGKTGINNYITYQGTLFEHDDKQDSNTDYALFVSDTTYKYPFIHYHSETQDYFFDCYNQKAISLIFNYFTIYEDSFYKETVNCLTVYAWNNDVYIPFSDFPMRNQNINLCFALNDYVYFIGCK